MQTVHETPATEKRGEKTEAGNYFASNYPPFSFWKSDQVSAVEAVLQQPAQDSFPIEK